MRRLEEDGEVAGFETSWTRLDGVTIHVRENVRAVRDATGQIVCYEGTIEDLTSHFQLEEQLRRAQKMEAIGRLAGGVAHGFNNLMQTVLSLTAMLRSLREQPERHEELLSELEEQINRGSTLTRQLLLFSRRDMARPEVLDLNDVIHASAALLNRIVRENVRFTVTLDPRPLPVTVDHGQLDQVLLNLVLNASEAMPEGGELKITSGMQEPSEAWFEVADEGCGIAEEIRDRIFEPFFTTKEAEKATGLGLAVSHGIVTAVKGRIEVRSCAGKGSVFRVVLPRVARPPRSETPSLAVAFRGVEGKGELLLVVEDEPGARQGLKDVLEMIGYRVKVTADAEEALALPDQPEFDILLSDVLLPGAHGAELARRLQERWPRLKVLLMSGYAEDESLQRGISEGKVRFLSKPFNMVTLARELRVALAGR
jgi:signal transduction histidine kinase